MHMLSYRINFMPVQEPEASAPLDLSIPAQKTETPEIQNNQQSPRKENKRKITTPLPLNSKPSSHLAQNSESPEIQNYYVPLRTQNNPGSFETFNHITNGSSLTQTTPMLLHRPITSPTSSGSSPLALCDTSSDTTMNCQSPTSSTTNHHHPHTTTLLHSRPFKQYQKNQSNIITSALANLVPSSSLSDENYLRFKETIISQTKPKTGVNQNMRRVSQNSNDNKNKDPVYLEKRRKNNEAAKRSRDARKAKEDDIAIRCMYLEAENTRLRLKIESLETELVQFRRIQNVICFNQG